MKSYPRNPSNRPGKNGSPKRGLWGRPWFLVVFFTFFMLFVMGVSLLKTPDDTTSLDIVIPRGSTLRTVSAQLEKENIISNATMFRRLLQVTGGSKRVRAGEFRFQRGALWLETIAVLYFQEPIVHSVTVPEGFNARQIAQILQQAQLGSATKFLAVAMNPEGPRKFGLHSPTLEGFLFPDTYNFSKVDGEERIAERMVQRFMSKLDNELRNRIRVSGMSLEQVVTLASIIEKETGASGERPLISSVFHNRLKKGMRLQSDPTTIYGIENFDGNLKKKHLLEKTAYNTYAIKGLPPGPIASPGLASIRATLAPADTNYLYFVANNQGGHLFSDTYEKHSRFVHEYQKRRPNRNSASNEALDASH